MLSIRTTKAVKFTGLPPCATLSILADFLQPSDKIGEFVRSIQIAHSLISNREVADSTTNRLRLRIGTTGKKTFFPEGER